MAKNEVTQPQPQLAKQVTDLNMLKKKKSCHPKTCSRCVELKKRLDRIDAEYKDIRGRLLDTASSPDRPLNTFPNTNNLYIQSDQLRITLDTVMRAQLFEIQQSIPNC